MLAMDAPLQAQPIVVVGTHEAAQTTPNTKESITAAKLRETVNVHNSEDALRYFPSLLVRERHIGDTQAPLATRTSGVGASARSLVYADGVLLSALIGNNNSFASPRWGMVSPEEIDHVDVLYGPFSAQYPGNSIGAVVNITTRMPEKLEASARVGGSLQHFSQYSTKGTYPEGDLAGTIGDKTGAFSWFLSASHVDSRAQPLAYVTMAVPSSLSPAGRPAVGAVPGLSRTGQPIDILGAGSIEHQRQDILKAKVAVDLSDSLKFTWMSGLFLNDTDAHADTYLEDASGNPIYSGTVNIGGHALTIPASAFSSQVYRFDERHWMHSARLEQSTDSYFWSLIGSLYNYRKDEQRVPSLALPAAEDGGAGSITDMAGTGWKTLDFHGYTRFLAGQELHAGAHYDGMTLKSDRYSTSDWIDGDEASLVQASKGHTRTFGLWAEDHVALAPLLNLTLGARYEWWRAFGGQNFSSSPALNVVQPERSSEGLSPKVSLRWQPANKWTLTLSGGRALRFPTVSELYQAITTGPTISVPNPSLKPEKALSAELAVERKITGGEVRLSLFHEIVSDALVSQSAPLVPGSTTLYSYVQNVGRTRTNGAELVIDKHDLLPGVDLSASATIADPKTVSDPVFPGAVGKLIPQVPRRKATLVASWRPVSRVTLTAAVRYQSRSFGTIDNSDLVGHTFQGFEGFVVADARAVYHLTAKTDVALGVENITDKRYFLYHPFPGRTFSAELHWHL